MWQEDLISFIKAFSISGKLIQEENEPPRDWSIRVLKYLNNKFPEKEWNEFFNKEDKIRQRREYFLYLWMVIYKIASQIGSDSGYYIDAHKKLKKAILDTKATKLNFIIAMGDYNIPLYKQMWECYREGMSIIETYARKGILIKYNEALFDFPSKFDRFKNNF